MKRILAISILSLSLLEFGSARAESVYDVCNSTDKNQINPDCKSTVLKEVQEKYLELKQIVEALNLIGLEKSEAYKLNSLIKNTVMTDANSMNATISSVKSKISWLVFNQFFRAAIPYSADHYGNPEDILVSRILEKLNSYYSQGEGEFSYDVLYKKPTGELIVTFTLNEFSEPNYLAVIGKNTGFSFIKNGKTLFGLYDADGDSGGSYIAYFDFKKNIFIENAYSDYSEYGKESETTSSFYQLNGAEVKKLKTFSGVGTVYKSQKKYYNQMIDYMNKIGFDKEHIASFKEKEKPLKI